MKLQEFISETLKQIITGVKEAQEYANSLGGIINPPKKGPGSNFIDSAENVAFDVAVTSTEGSETKGGVGVFVAAFGLGAQGKTDMSSSSISRIKFSVSVFLPPGNRPNEKEQTAKKL